MTDPIIEAQAEVARRNLEKLYAITFFDLASTPTTIHDFRRHTLQLGHSISSIAHRNEGKSAMMAGNGYGLAIGHYLLLAHPKTALTAIYLVTGCRYFHSPRDRWQIDTDFVPQSSLTPTTLDAIDAALVSHGLPKG